MLVHGGDDKLVPPEGTKILSKRASSDDKIFKLYDGLYHEIFNEPEREKVLLDVSDWLDAHI